MRDRRLMYSLAAGMLGAGIGVPVVADTDEPPPSPSRRSRMGEVIWHRSRVFERWGGTVTTTLCGRSQDQSDGMNVADSDDDVTCKLCLRRMAQIAKRDVTAQQEKTDG